MDESQRRFQSLVAEVAAAYFSNSHVSPGDISRVITQIADSLQQVAATPATALTHAPAPQQRSAPPLLTDASAPAADQVPLRGPSGAEEAEAPTLRRLSRAEIQKSITPDALISFEDGRPYKTLRRHLSARGLTPQDYREKWGLPRDYPMVAPTYSQARSKAAKAIGLSRRGTEARAAQHAAGQSGRAPHRKNA